MVSDRVTSQPHHVTTIKQAASEQGYAAEERRGSCSVADRSTGNSGEGG